MLKKILILLIGLLISGCANEKLITKIKLEGCQKCEISGEGLGGADLKDVNLSEAQLFKADLDQANLTEANLTKANLMSARLNYANLTSANLTEANLSKAELIGAKLEGINLNGANLHQAKMTGVSLKGANLTNANLTGADLNAVCDTTNIPTSIETLVVAVLKPLIVRCRYAQNKSDLSNANLTNANLTGTGLIFADLTNVNLTGANLTDADLSGATLDGANLTNANLSRAKLGDESVFIPQVKIAKTILCNTTLPDLKIDNSGCSKGKGGKKIEIAKTTPPNTAQPPKSKINAIATGTGFLFGSHDYIITNYHVVKGTSKVNVKFLNEETIEAKVVAKDTQNDVAILQLNKTPSVQFSEMKFGDSSNVRMGDQVFTIGYPSIGVMGVKPKYTEGVISSVTGIKDDPTVFQTTVPIQPGNSGGPLFNEEGEVVGLTTSSLSFNAIDILGAVPQNVNYAIKSSFVKNTINSVPKALLSNRGIVVTLKENNSRADFIEKLSKNVVLILGDVK